MVTSSVVSFWKGDTLIRTVELQDGAPLPSTGEKVRLDPGDTFEVVDVVHDYPGGNGDPVNSDDIVGPEILVEVKRT